MTLTPEIDAYPCVAHGDCAVVARRRSASTTSRSSSAPPPEDVLRDAARACPAGAIILVDNEIGEEVDPG
ncbi:MAG: ferredoxin [Actinomycetota bacterium]|nr:ferredoxin [Actinomycetota bacterium]